MNWKIGQKLVCVNNYPNKNPSTIGKGVPQKDDIVTVDGVICNRLYLSEHNYYAATGRVHFDPSFFRPLLGDSARTELISSFVEVTETSDCPINVPQTETICS